MCMEKKVKWTDHKYIVLLLITGAVYFFLRFISPLATPIILAGMFLTLCYPTFDDIQRKTRIKKQYMASAILLLICTVLIVLVWIGGSFVLQHLPLWVEGIDDVQSNIQVFVQDCSQGAGDFLGIDTERLTQMLIEQVDVFVENFQTQLLPQILGGTWIYVKHLISTIAILAVTMIATVLLAKDYDTILSWMGAHEDSRLVLEVALKVLRYIATFVKAQFIIMLSIGSVCSILLLLSGVERPILFGVLAGILDALPFIGTGIVLMPLGIWQLVNGHYIRALFCVAAYVICTLIREFVEPKLIGKKVGVYPAAILLSVYAGLKLFGLWGIIKGPIGLVMIRQIYEVYCRLVDGRKQLHYDKEEIVRKEGAK